MNLFIWIYVLYSIFLRINVITSDHTDGNQRIMSGDLKSVSTFYFVWDEPDPACKTEFYRRKKRRNAL